MALKVCTAETLYVRCYPNSVAYGYMNKGDHIDVSYYQSGYAYGYVYGCVNAWRWVHADYIA